MSEWVSEWVIECHSSASKSPWHDYVIHELKTKLTRQTSFSFRELSDTANRWKDIANDGNLISVYKLKSNKSQLSMYPGVSSWIPGQWSAIVTYWSRNLLCVVLFWSFEMFTGSVIDIFFSKKGSLLAVTHFTIERKVLLLKIVYVRLSLFMIYNFHWVLKRGYLSYSLCSSFIYLWSIVFFKRNKRWCTERDVYRGFFL